MPQQAIRSHHERTEQSQNCYNAKAEDVTFGGMMTYKDEYKECLKANKILKYKLEMAEKKLDKLRMDLEAD